MKEKRLPAVCLLLTTCCLLLASCGGGLTDEQRKKIKEEMKTSQIKKVSEAEVVEATLAKGRALTTILSKKVNQDSVAKAEQVKIKWLVAGQPTATEIEKQLIEAYLSQAIDGALDNVQKIGNDSLLYTVPVLQPRSDGSNAVTGVWSFCFSRKQIVLGL
jgi:hypothetical protein